MSLISSGPRSSHANVEKFALQMTQSQFEVVILILRYGAAGTVLVMFTDPIFSQCTDWRLQLT
jgi:hypothetical protein